MLCCANPVTTSIGRREAGHFLSISSGTNVSWPPAPKADQNPTPTKLPLCLNLEIRRTAANPQAPYSRPLRRPGRVLFYPQRLLAVDRPALRTEHTGLLRTTGHPRSAVEPCPGPRSRQHGSPLREVGATPVSTSEGTDRPRGAHPYGGAPPAPDGKAALTDAPMRPRLQDAALSETSHKKNLGCVPAAPRPPKSRVRQEGEQSGGQGLGEGRDGDTAEGVTR